MVSATGSTRMGRIVGERLARRFARAILELGGNNASIVTPSADLDLTLRAVAFAAMGTAGQRCTTLRRLIVHESVYDALVPKLASVYRYISVGSPISSDALVGPLIDGAAYEAMQRSRCGQDGRGASFTAAGASTSTEFTRSMSGRRSSRCRRKRGRWWKRPSRPSST